MWQQVFDQRLLQYNTPLSVDYLFRSSALRINAALDKNAAFPFGKGEPRRLYLGNYQIQFDNPLSYSYNLEIFIHLWTSQLDLTIWQTNEEPNIQQAIKLKRIQSSIEAARQDLAIIQQSINTNSGQ